MFIDSAELLKISEQLTAASNMHKKQSEQLTAASKMHAGQSARLRQLATGMGSFHDGAADWLERQKKKAEEVQQKAEEYRDRAKEIQKEVEEHRKAAEEIYREGEKVIDLVKGEVEDEVVAPVRDQLPPEHKGNAGIYIAIGVTAALTYLIARR